MQRGNYECQSEFAGKYVAEGQEEGRRQGREEGFNEAVRTAVFEVLDVRGLEVDAEMRQRILDCKDPAQLKLWLRKAAVVQSVQELFEPGPVPTPVAR